MRHISELSDAAQKRLDEARVAEGRQTANPGTKNARAFGDALVRLYTTLDVENAVSRPKT